MHDLTFEINEDGWDCATCDCGWTSPPCPDIETAADSWGDHKQEIGTQQGVAE